MRRVWVSRRIRTIGAHRILPNPWCRLMNSVKAVRSIGKLWEDEGFILLWRYVKATYIALFAT